MRLVSAFSALALTVAAVVSRGDIRFVAHHIDTNTRLDIHGQLRGSKSDGGRRLSATTDIADKLSSDASQVWLVHVEEDLGTQELKRLQTSAGVRFGDYIPSNTYVIYDTFQAATRLRDLQGVLWVGDYPKEAKFTGSLAKWWLSQQEIDSTDAVVSPPGHRVGLAVHLVKGVAESKGESDLVRLQWASQWNSEHKDKGLQPSWEAAPGALYLNFAPGHKVSLQLLLALADWLADKPEVYALQELQAINIKNYYAQTLIQSGDPLANSETGRPIWNHGIMGEGQIVGGADTGIDVDHCMFRDEDGTVKELGEKHRKVMKITTTRGAPYDGPSGHGTHVFASIAGNPMAAASETMKSHKGMAPKARLVIHDIADEKGAVYTPANLANIFQPAYDLGARVHSNSWGCNAEFEDNCNSYSDHARQVDDFMWKHPDFLIVFAAGNDGEMKKVYTGSVGAPATAKNALAVGASQTSNQGFLDAAPYLNFTEREEAYKITLGDPTFDCCAASGYVKAYCCADGFADKVKDNPKNYRELNLAVFSSRGPTWDLRNKPDLVAPGEQIVSARSDGIADSNNCDDATGLLAMQGTSMATPVVSGAAALVREYFLKGFYPTGMANESHSMAPSSSLIKAVLANGARALEGRFDPFSSGFAWKTTKTIFPLSSSTALQGFGKIQLDTVLLFEDSEHTLYLDDQGSFTETGQMKDYCFEVLEDATIKVILAWNEPPSALNAESAALNDLDVIAGSPVSSTIAGNFLSKRDTRNNMEVLYFPPFIATWDRPSACMGAENYVGCVRGASKTLAKGETINVKVLAQKLRSTEIDEQHPQTYSLVVTSYKGKLGPASHDCKFNVANDFFKAADEQDHEYHFITRDPLQWGIVIGIIVVAVLLIIGCITCICCCVHRRKKQTAVDIDPAKETVQTGR